jgi:hypothetical protein
MKYDTQPDILAEWMSDVWKILQRSDRKILFLEEQDDIKSDQIVQQQRLINSMSKTLKTLEKDVDLLKDEFRAYKQQNNLLYRSAASGIDGEIPTKKLS